MRRIFGAEIRCYCSFFQEDLVEFLVRYSLCKTPMEFPATIESPRDLCCLQP